MSFIKIERLSKTYVGGVGIRDIDFAISKGRFVSIVGPFGSGKTTILRIIAGLESYDTGEVMIDGLSPSAAKAQRRIGVGFQQPTLLPWRSVFENVTLPLEIIHNSDFQHAEQLIELAGLASIRDKNIESLSGGMRQLVSIMRSLVLKPDIMLLDEPFSSIDEMTKDIMHEKLLDIHKKNGSTTLLVTHSLQEAVYLSDMVIVLSSSPGTIKSVIDIDFERKSIADKYGDIAMAYVKKLRKELEL